jgi:hypothetical protein
MMREGLGEVAAEVGAIDGESTASGDGVFVGFADHN